MSEQFAIARRDQRRLPDSLGQVNSRVLDTEPGAPQILVPLLLAALSAAFFAVSFVVNRGLATHGGPWEWTACLRFLFVLPMFGLIVGLRRGLTAVARELRRSPGKWMVWSTVGFVVFYVPICFAARTAPGWVVASTWQITIVCGILAAPFLYSDHRRRIPGPVLMVSVVILFGVALVQVGHDKGASPTPEVLIGVLAVVVAAIAYPVGNRKSMVLAGDHLDTWQRLLAMSTASLPVWLVVTVLAVARDGPPSTGQVTGVVIVTVCSGVIATALFFAATRRVQHDPGRLAAIEATQALEAVIVAIAEPVVLGSAAPRFLAWTGIVVITLGVLGSSALGGSGAVVREA